MLLNIERQLLMKTKKILQKIIIKSDSILFKRIRFPDITRYINESHAF